MTIILPPDYHAQKALEENRIICITEEFAQKEDIRALRIGILNIMPEVQTYEFNLLHPLGRSILQIIPIWIKLHSHSYSSSNKTHLNQLYQTFDEAMSQAPLDGMIITGAPVESLDFQEVRYWDEVKEILETCRKMIPSTLGICWGALALANLLGLEKTNFPKKLFGVFETLNLQYGHRITGGLDDVFWLPESRHSGIPNSVMEEAKEAGIINLLAHSKEAGYPIFESCDHRYLMITGHLEYNANRIVEEALRDKYRPDVSPPKHFDIDKAHNRWRGQRNEFFAQWIKYIHEKTNKNYKTL